MTDKRESDSIIIKGKPDYKKYIVNTFLIITMTIVTIIILYPMLFVVSTSFKTYAEFLESPFSLSFKHASNYAEAWIDGNFSRYFMNSVIVTGLTLFSKVFMSAIVAFCIGVLNFKGYKIFMVIIIATMFFTGEITGIPTFIMINGMGLKNSIGALIVPGILAPAGLGVILGVSYVKKIPKELHEAALLDGAGIWTLFSKIDFILMIPMMTLVAVQTFTASWSDFFWPLITVSGNESAKTLPLGLIAFQSQNNSKYGVLAAGLVIQSIPIVLLYCCLSKYFIEGVAAGAVKG